MQQSEFHNALRVLMSIDHHEVSFLNAASWTSFRDEPYRFFIRCDDEVRAKLWEAIEARTARRTA